MFTVNDIKQAHAKVKSGADFPKYIQEIKELGVQRYTAYVCDGHTDYFGENNHIATVPAKYDVVRIAELVDTEVFKRELIAHQQGKTDYLTFITMCAETGIEKWEISMEEMTCTYFDHSGNSILKEKIPTV